MAFKDKEAKRSVGVAAAMISEETKRAARGEAPVAQGRETKKRYNLVILPSVYEDVQKIAYIDRSSVSEIVGQLLADYVEANADKLAEYENTKK